VKRAPISYLLVGLLVGIAIGWVGHILRAEKDLRSVLVARDLERATFAVNTLNMQAEQPEKVEKLQLLILRSSLENLEELTREHVELQVKTTALRQGLQRAGVYAKAHEMPDLEEKASIVSNRLFGGA
jgi:hypothetical protein